MRAIILALFLFALDASAVVAVTRYVDTTCTNNGDGTGTGCAASVGAAGAYKTLANAATGVAAAYPNFVTSDVQVTIDCRGTTEDTSYPVFSGMTTDATRYLAIGSYGANKHSGTYTTSKYRIANDDYYGVIRTGVANFRIENLQIKATANTTPNRGIRFEAGAGGGQVRVTGNIIWGAGTTTDTSNRGIEWDGSSVTVANLIVANNLIYDFADDGMNIYGGTANDKFVIYNNTISDCGGNCLDLTGYGATDTAKVRNNLWQNCTAANFLLTSTFTTYVTQTNITMDATSPDGASFQSKTATFTNRPSKDYTLSSSDSVAKDLATNLSADGDYAFAVDFAGTTRPQGSAWDIGTSEAAAAAAGSVATILTASGEI